MRILLNILFLLHTLPWAVSTPNGSPLCTFRTASLGGSPHSLSSASPAEFEITLTNVTSSTYQLSISGTTFQGAMIMMQSNTNPAGTWIAPSNPKWAANTDCPTVMTHTQNSIVSSAVFTWQATSDLASGAIIQPVIWVAISQSQIHQPSMPTFTLSSSGTGEQQKSTSQTNKYIGVICAGFAAYTMLYILLSACEYWLNRRDRRKRQS